MTGFRFPLPAAPNDDGVTTTIARAGNPLLDWLNITDSDGGIIAHYRLMLEPAYYNLLHKIVYSGGVELCYAVFLVLAAYGAAGLELLLTPDRWLGPLTDFYSGVTAAIYQKVPPLAILAVTFGFLILSVFMRRGGAPAAGPGGRTPNAPPPGLLEQWMPSNAQISKAQWNRLGSGMVLMAIVIVLAYNPLKMIQEVVNTVVAAASELTFTGNQGGAATYAASGVANILRDTTFLINYRALLDSDCARQWSQAINVGSGNPSCLTPSQYAATDPDFWTLILAVLALPIAWGIAKFLWVAGKKLLNHLSLTVVYLVAATWVAAGTLARRRPYDPLANLAARFATHFLLTIGILFVTAAFPALFIKLFIDVLSFLPAVLQIPLVSLAFYVSALVLNALLKNKESIVDLFRDRVKKTQTWNNMFNVKADQKTIAGQMIGPVGAQLAAPWGWVTDRYSQAQDWTQQRWTQLRDGTGAPNQEGGAMNVPVLPDTPETIGAQRRIRLNPEPPTDPAERPVLDPAAAITPADRPGRPTPDPTSSAQPVAVVGSGGVTVPALPAGPTTAPGAPGYAWFRGGIPQSMPTPSATANPVTVSSPPAPQSPPLVSDDEPSTPGSPRGDLADRTGFFHRRAATLREEAAAMRTPAPAEADLLAAASRTYRTAAAPGETVTLGTSAQVAGTAATAAATQRPDFKALLSSAQWAHSLQRAKNLMAARGITTPPTLAASAVTAERIVFASDEEGHAVVRRKNERGFGDSI
ncbi:hypothetical protein [Mycolicibacterium goodii]|uniref:hypothetical protein n=1 Tax=Mycolicibacterium goodii TaxID=134601 RepID=UPI001BDD12A2|nr:hypothetical protein [Mycolicibacterium goodii]MBU8841195.1 hypothetical protein [Mycolicibacterium goodii]